MNRNDGASPIRQAIILAAGRGVRFRPITDTIPKPLVRVHHKPLIEWQLDMLAAQGVESVVINCCYLADLLKNHVASLNTPLHISFSTETTALETGGGIKNALHLMDNEPFIALNSDVIFDTYPRQFLAPLHNQLTTKSDLLIALLLHETEHTIGIASQGDFFCNDAGALSRRGTLSHAPYIFSGIQLIHPSVFDGIDNTVFSMNVVYDKLLGQHNNAIKGVINHGNMMLHVGDPEGHKASEAYLLEKSQDGLSRNDNAIEA